jgi:cation-transporting P-type ATPase C
VRLSTATALSAAICTAARSGILVKGGNYIEALEKADTLILDKTGTMTEGRPVVKEVSITAQDTSEREVLELAAAAEETCQHPMSVAILNRVRAAGWKIPRHTKSEILTARGVQTRVGGKTIRVGSRLFMKENEIDLSAAEKHVQKLVRGGDNVLYVAREDELLAVLGLRDTLRENMKKTLNRLRRIRIDDVILLTGDVEQQAEIVASRMAMDHYEAEVLPDQKAETVLKLQSRGGRVVMVGDGVNDAPALAYADVGIAIGGSRTDIAMEAADITITSDDPLMVASAIQLAQKTMRIISQNFLTSIGVNTVGLVLASVGVLPVFWGAVLHNSCTVAVVLNSSRLMFHDLERDS